MTSDAESEEWANTPLRRTSSQCVTFVVTVPFPLSTSTNVSAPVSDASKWNSASLSSMPTGTG